MKNLNRNATLQQKSQTHSISVRVALLSAGMLFANTTADAQGSKQQASPPAKSSAAQRAVVADSVKYAAKLREEDAMVNQRLMALRAKYLKGSSWANLGDRCNPGALRIFPKDTSTAQRDSLNAVALRIEQTVIGRGAGGTDIDTPEGRALLRTIVGWEAGIDRPNWDSDDKVVRQAISTGLTGEYPDPRGTGCLSSTDSDTVTIVAPGFNDIIFPKSSKIRIKAYLGKDGIKHARNEFVSANRNNPAARLSYIYISPVTIWRDWAVVVATRPIEERGIVVGKTNNGGAAYLMRKVGTEWRLLTILRTWGS